MVNVNCSGGQDRDTTTSETHPDRPPPKTKNCYLTDGFDRDRCGTADDGACPPHGGAPSCIPDDYGGYCKDNDRYYQSVGSSFVRLSNEDLLNRHKSDSPNTDIRVRRALRDQERIMTNKIRELQIMGRGPIQKENPSPSKKTVDDDDNNEVHNSISSILFNIGMVSSILIFIASLSFILIHKKVI
jgi:hypothetical protein